MREGQSRCLLLGGVGENLCGQLFSTSDGLRSQQLFWLIGHSKVSPSAKDGEVEQREREQPPPALGGGRRPPRG